MNHHSHDILHEDNQILSHYVAWNKHKLGPYKDCKWISINHIEQYIPYMNCDCWTHCDILCKWHADGSPYEEGIAIAYHKYMEYYPVPRQVFRPVCLSGVDYGLPSQQINNKFIQSMLDWRQEQVMLLEDEHTSR